GLADLTRPEVKFINRQRASGTRLLLDRLLSQAGIAPTAIAGYEEEEFTHLAVAASVAGGLADAGFGIQAAAHQLGLHFVPLVRERYLLAMTRQTFRSPALQALVALLRSPEFEAKAGDLVGYDFSRAGEPVPLPGTSGSTRDRAGKMLR
ncbi:MAG: LysR family transcriptional regulator, partial [Azospira oryzae]